MIDFQKEIHRVAGVRRNGPTLRLALTSTLAADALAIAMNDAMRLIGGAPVIRHGQFLTVPVDLAALSVMDRGDIADILALAFLDADKQDLLVVPSDDFNALSHWVQRAFVPGLLRALTRLLSEDEAVEARALGYLMMERNKTVSMDVDVA